MIYLNSILLGIGLAMDAFSVSLANGLNEPRMKKGRMCGIAGIFGGFQFAMPMIGWICLHTIVEYFTSFHKFIPWIALVLLLFIGGKMLTEGIRENRANGCSVSEQNGPEASETQKDEKSTGHRLPFRSLLVQGIATSIDALSVGFTISEYGTIEALLSSLIIGAVTFVICMAGLRLGKTFGEKLSGRAQILGGIILIGIGLEIFIKGVFF
jgi:putative Mn2+ efflux pump MntP